MRNPCWFLVLLWLLPALVSGQTATHYSLTFPNAVHHEAQVTVIFEGVQTPVLEARMARSSPGRYALHEFAKNVYAVKAENSKGEPLPIARPNPHQWNVSGHDGTVKITYTLFGDRIDGTYASIDETHAHLNAPATLMYDHGFTEQPSYLNLEVPEGKNWTAATQLKPETGTALSKPARNYRFSAPNLQYLMDSPLELADFTWYEWPVAGPGNSQLIRFALHHQGTIPEADRFMAETKKAVTEAAAVFGELPAFDYGTYTFIGCYLPHAASDGMEHRNSTVLTSPRPLKTGAARNLGTVSHEFFHAWNVERLRPQNLEPFNFAEANMSDALWFAEGFTSYYGDLLLVRSGALTPEAYFSSLSGTLNNYQLLPGKDLYSPAEMSLLAPFVDAARSVDNTNWLNNYVSHYTHGEVLGLALDLSLRTNFPDVTLDTYLQALWQRYGKTGKFYTLKDLEQTLADVTRNEPFASEFFQKYIYGHAPLNFRELLLAAGLEFKPMRPGKASLGYAPLGFANGRAVMQAGTVKGSPLYLAGVENEAVLLKLNNRKITSAQALATILKKQKPGDVVTLEFEQRGQVKTVPVKLIEDPEQEIYFPAAGKTLPAAETFRRNWLGSKAK